jgi:hypothetical protein
VTPSGDLRAVLEAVSTAWRQASPSTPKEVTLHNLHCTRTALSHLPQATTSLELW